MKQELLKYQCAIYAYVFFWMFAINAGFPAGTLVKTPDGYRAIETLDIGDAVVCYDFEHNRQVVQSVIDNKAIVLSNPVTLIIADQVVITKPSQRIYVSSLQKWMHAIELKEYLGDGYGQDILLYELSITKCHNFYITTDDILVHNVMFFATLASLSWGAGTSVTFLEGATIANVLAGLGAAIVAKTIGKIMGKKPQCAIDLNKGTINNTPVPGSTTHRNEYDQSHSNQGFIFCPIDDTHNDSGFSQCPTSPSQQIPTEQCAGSSADTITASVKRSCCTDSHHQDMVDATDCIGELQPESLINQDIASVENSEKVDISCMSQPGKPTKEDGYTPPKKWDGKKVKNPNGCGMGWPDDRGRIWIPSGSRGHGGLHWDVQCPKGGYNNVYPGGTIRSGKKKQ